jgi:hypothetical protein
MQTVSPGKIGGGQSAAGKGVEQFGSPGGRPAPVSAT